MSGNDLGRKILVIGGVQIPPSGSTKFVEHTPPARYTKTVGGGGRPCYNRNRDKSIPVTIMTYAHEAAHGLLGQLYAQQEANALVNGPLLRIPYKYLDLDTGDVVAAGGAIIMQAPAIDASTETPERTWTLDLFAANDIHGATVDTGPV